MVLAVPASIVPPASAGEFTIEFFEDDDGRSPVEEWMDSDLTDLELAALVSGLEHVLSHRGIDVCRTEWGKQLGEGLFEFRIRHSAAEIEHMFTGTSSSRQAAKGEKVLLPCLRPCLRDEDRPAPERLRQSERSE
jgi:hypothetical protein